MRMVIQRVLSASVEIDQEVHSAIQRGFLIYLGLTHQDTTEEVKKAVDKILKLRVFEDHQGKMNLDIHAVSGACLVVSQFTLYGDISKGNRPSFVQAAKPELANLLYEHFISLLSEKVEVKTGVFGANMNVISQNDGPVTILYE